MTVAARDLRIQIVPASTPATDPHFWLRRDAEVDLYSRRRLAAILATEAAVREVRRRRMVRAVQRVQGRLGTALLPAMRSLGVSAAEAAEGARRLAAAIKGTVGPSTWPEVHR